MALLRIPEENRTISGPEAVAEYLARVDIDYERWVPQQAFEPDAPPEAVLAAYSREIDRLKARGGYVTADVIEVQEFPELIERYRVRGVPKVIINERVQFEGALPEPQFIRQVVLAVDGQTQPTDGEEDADA